MSTTRRAFLAQLAAAFGAANIPDLRMRIEDRGSPILLQPRDVQKSLHVYTGGLLMLGAEEEHDHRYRPTWRELLAV